LEPARKLPPPSDDAEKKSIKSRTGMLRLVVKREQSLLSLIELSHELTLSLDFYETADLALQNLMAQMGTPKAAVWIIRPETDKEPILLRSQGLRKPWARALGTACGPKLAKIAADSDMPLLVEEVAGEFGTAATKLAEECGIALFAPIRARKKLFGFIALGHRGDGEPYGVVDLQVLSASLGMLGVSLENNGLYNRLLEKHRQLLAANKNLEELDRLKSEFLRNINHELRTPLTIIIAYLTFLLEQEDGDEQKRDFLSKIHEESMKLKRLVEKLLDFSAMHNEGVGIQIETGDLEGLVISFHQERLPGVAETLHEFALDIEGKIPMIRFDPHRVRQILDALVDNAIKFTPQGSKLTLRLRKETAEETTWIRIDLEDNGPGIPPEKLPHIFDAFRQGDGSSTRSVGGIGMGLAYARQLAENMGGRLEAGGEPGQGAVLSLILPAA